ncbi:MAG: transcription antitermination factor NusB [Verrucomicrobiota bacterium]|nr:transcription antitermination factor NusB [Verrucomicrobiota bacterium]
MDDDLVINPKWSQRRQNRCAAFRFIFQWEMNSSEDFQQDLTEYFIRLEKGEEYFSYAIELIAGVMDKMEILDSIIRELVQNWEFSRIAKVELAMLRVALYELKYRLDVPPVVIIDEALEISKDFSTDDSRKFLNGVLDKAMLQMTRPTRKPAI